MKTVFQNLGLEFSEKEKPNFTIVRVSYIRNSDHSIRWIWSAGNHKPEFLRFYNASSFRAATFALFVKIIFLLRLQHIVFRTRTVYYKSLSNALPLIKENQDWSLFTGTKGPNNKMVLYTDKHFLKIACTEKSQQLLQNEYEVLTKLEETEKFYIRVPKAEKMSDSVLKLSDVGKFGRRWTKVSYLHSWALIEMDRIANDELRVCEWKRFQDLKKEFENITASAIPEGIRKKIATILGTINDQDNVILSFSHGDFTPWNSFVSDEYCLSIYDWELSSSLQPRGFDFFHFIIQNGILVQRKSWKQIYIEIQDKNKVVFNMSEDQLQKYLKYYLLVNIMEHVCLYAKQQVWHTQVNWLMATWTQALNMFVAEKFTDRQLIILDTFDFLKNRKYATLKFPEISPELLSTMSDIDLVTTKQVSKELKRFFRSHDLAHKIFRERKSFMTETKIITKDFETLSIDCITQLKWKNLQILSAQKTLAESLVNSFGIKTASFADLKRYLILFYKLNKAEIPAKYSKEINNVKLIDTRFDEVLNGALEQGMKGKEPILHSLKRQNANRGLRYVKNTINYVLDSFSGKGFIITFSGVDGAGKTTVITEISQMMNKNFRKPVVVLRHRPSVLPILSVWTKGKEKAQQDTLASLPRQGNNQSLISSLLRFSYYFVDYLLGQFVVYLKHVLRGHIVIYDRYYFDFIVDSKRSNIELPKSIAKFGYRFLLKPNYNFFLYANPEVILIRKQELSKTTIEKLTSKYRRLFSNLKKENDQVVYQSINNVDLQETLEEIRHAVFAQ